MHRLCLLATILLAGPAAAADRSVYVAQIGSGNVAIARQAQGGGDATIRQTGDDNRGELTQAGSGAAAAAHRATLTQTGDRNAAVVQQDGWTANRMTLNQTGTGNIAQATQSATAGGNIGAIVQTGNANMIALKQDGGDNLAELTQTGNNNAMDASQTGTGNRLSWTQTGDNLANLGISQTGNQIVQITQSR